MKKYCIESLLNNNAFCLMMLSIIKTTIMKKFYAIILLLAFCIAKTNNLKAQVNVNDSLALVDLYNSTNGKHWFHHKSWIGGRVENWYGITVTGNRVTGIALQSNHLRGSLPASLGNLTNLSTLYLDDNHINGSIPSSLGNLIQLYDLSLYYNDLSGSIPSELGNLTNLGYLYLSYNKLTGNIPSSLKNITNLYSLRLSANQLSGSIPAELTELTNLHALYLDHNQLSGKIPSSLGNLINLGDLVLNNNQLSGKIPSSLGNLISLAILALNNNQLTGSIPPSFKNFKSLSSLYLDHNQLSGKIPAGLSQSKYLFELDLSHNKLSGSVPSSFMKLRNLTKLILRDNELRDTVPAFFAKFRFLDYLDVVNNHFTFDGLETIAKQNKIYRFLYKEEKKIVINQTSNILSVYAGGTLSNNTYKWYKDGSLVSTIHGDSTFTPSANGVYYVEVTNSIATALTLSSDIIHYTSSSGLQQNAIAASINNKNAFSVYPNPAKNIVTVSFVANGNYILKFIDVNGNILQTKTGVADKSKNILQLNIGNYAAGNYFITITDEQNKSRALKLNKE